MYSEVGQVVFTIYIFVLSGFTIYELIIKKLFNYSESDNVFHDRTKKLSGKILIKKC